MFSFAEATQLTPLTETTYAAHLPEDWCIGSVPHGGFVAALFLRTAAIHLSSTHPHALVLHLTFLRRTSVGAALLTVSQSKLGSRTSTLHITLSASSASATPLVAGYVTQTHLALEEGLSLPTEWSLNQSPPHLGPHGFRGLKNGVDENWTERRLPFSAFRRAVRKVRIWTPTRGPVVKGVMDEWICWRDEESKFTQESLAFVADMWPQIVETYEEVSATRQEVPEAASEPITVPDITNTRTEHDSRPKPNPMQQWTAYWYPTVAMTLDVKKLLPAEGVEFLSVRAQAKQIRNGRFDLEVTIKDGAGDLVALSHHVCLVVGVERNTAPRTKENMTNFLKGRM